MADSPVLPVLVTGLLALLGTALSSVFKSCQDTDLASRQRDSQLVLKALESPVDSIRLNTLDMLTQTHLISDEEIRKGVQTYRDNIRHHKTTSPQVLAAPAVATLAAPSVPNTRVYLLTGRAASKALLDTLSVPLNKAGFNVIGSKYLDDQGRPNSAEVRYFYPADSEQAQRLASFFGLKLHQPPPAVTGFAGKKYGVTRPGYLEIWTGR